MTTNEGNVFFTNTETKTSVWTVPEEIKGLVQELEAKKKQDAEDARRKAEADAKAEAARLLQEKEAEMQRLREELEREREASRKRKLEEEQKLEARLELERQKMAAEREREREEQEQEQEQRASKKAKISHEPNGYEENGQQSGEENGDEQHDDEPLEDWQLDELAAKAEIEAELQSPAPPALPEIQLSSEEAIALFKTMLEEKDINPMRPWDMELPKFINDSRYQALKTMRERRDVFDEFCKQKVRENRAKKNAASQAKMDPVTAYRALLVAEVTSTRTHWEEFRKKFKKDARFRDFGRDEREREKAFRNWLRELGEIKRADAQKAEVKFTEMLAEKEIADDARWSDVKSRFASDPRYNAVASSSQREELFKKYLAKRAAQPATSRQPEDPEEAKRRAAEERKAKQAASLKEREEKVRREKEALERAAGRSRATASKEEAEREYKSLLIDAVRDHEAKWSDMLPTFEKDPRFTSSTLSMSARRQLFEDHLNEVYDKRINALEALFATHSPSLQTSFEQVYSSISGNPLVTRLHMSESRLNKLFDDWNRKRFMQARKEFDALLAESSFVEYWGKLKQEAASKEEERTKGILGDADEAEEGEDGAEGTVDLKAMAAQIDLGEIEAVLKHDKRYSIFDYDPETRSQWIQDHLARLGRPKQSVHSRD